ncbi:MAG TPA: DUF928 domain-containing protein [Nostocaceae cyanobacterium]|nr:DUF928 domain-containing protein [Nostocaceae cyanobacterium]
MIKHNLQRPLWPLVLAPLLAIAVLTPIKSVEGVTFQPKGRPTQTAGGASRGNCLSLLSVSNTKSTASNRVLTALIPSTDMELTTAAYPTILVDFPQTNAATIEFSLWDDEGNGIYQTNIPLKDKAGIIGIQVPQAAGPLAVGKQYKWSVAMICDSSERQRDVVLEGFVQRVQPSADLASKLQSADPLQKAKIYAENGFWYDTAATLAELRRLNPQDQQITSAWQELLESVGLTEHSQLPIRNCCQAQN